VLDDFPAAQAVHALALVAPGTLEYEPAGQLTHALALLAPEYAPAEHLVHAVAPSTFEYAPAEQFTHGLASDRKYLPTEQVIHEPVIHPLTCTSRMAKYRSCPYIEM
jgi:hypothetical protein